MTKKENHRTHLEAPNLWALRLHWGRQTHKQRLCPPQLPGFPITITLTGIILRLTKQQLPIGPVPGPANMQCLGSETLQWCLSDFEDLSMTPPTSYLHTLAVPVTNVLSIHLRIQL